MIAEFWSKISYMVQLIVACTLFVLPARKKKNFTKKMLVCALGLLVVCYVLNSICEVSSTSVLGLIYWAYYIVACAFFAWISLDGSVLRAVYCAVCACAVQHIAFDICLIYDFLFESSNVWTGIVYFLIYFLVYGMFYFFLAQNLTQRGEFVVSKKSLFPMVTIILLVWIFSLWEGSGMSEFESETGHRLIYRFIDALCCFYVLWVQYNQKEKMRLQTELDGINNAWRQQIKQYQITSETIDIINRKCHDLKHQIRALRCMTDEKEKEEFLNDIENAIMIYDTALKTGNKALDIVLMEKGLFCKNHEIQWSCMADGSKLDFIKVEDIYAIFGNALDNAIEEVMELSDPQKRTISVKIITQEKLTVIQIQNYYEKQLRFEDGVPVTTKQNKKEHGYGIKSIWYTVEKYNGTITVKAENQIFTLQMLIPIKINS